MSQQDFLDLLQQHGINLTVGEIRSIVGFKSEQDISDIDFVEEPDLPVPVGSMAEQRKIALPILLRLMELRPDLSPAQIASTSHMIAKLFLQEV